MKRERRPPMDFDKRIEELLAIRGTGEKRAEAMRWLILDVALECVEIAESYGDAHAERHHDNSQNLADLVADKIRERFIPDPVSSQSTGEKQHSNA